MDQVGELMAVQQRAASLGALLNDAIAARLGITGSDLKCLYLVLAEPRTPRELADALRLRASTITSILDRLERSGFVRREHSPTDRRRMLVSAIAERAEEAVRLYQPLAARTAGLLATYDEDQLAVLREFAERSVDILTEQLARIETD